jgi:hypothetical protein
MLKRIGLVVVLATGLSIPLACSHSHESQMQRCMDSVPADAWADSCLEGSE